VAAGSIKTGLQRYQTGVDILRMLPPTTTAHELLPLIHEVDFDFESIAPPYFPEDLRDMYRQIKKLQYDHWVRARHVERLTAVSNSISFGIYTEWLVAELLPWLQATTTTPEEWSSAALDNVLPWVAQADRYDINLMPTALNDMGRFLLAPDMSHMQLERIGIGYLDRPKRASETKNITMRWAPLYDALRESAHPVLNFYGTAGQVLNLHPKKDLTKSSCDIVWNAGMALIDSWPSRMTAERYQSYHAVLNAIMRFPYQEMPSRYRELFLFMVAKNEFVYGVAWRAAFFQHIAVKISAEDRKTWSDRVAAYVRRNDLVYLYPPEDTSIVRHGILEKVASQAGVAAENLLHLQPASIRTITMDSSYWDDAPRLFHHDPVNGVMYLFTLGFTDYRNVARTDNPALIIPDPDDHHPPHLFMEFYKLTIPEASLSEPLWVQLGAINLVKVYADTNRLLAWRQPEDEIVEMNMEDRTISLQHLRDLPFAMLTSMMLAGNTLYCLEYNSNLYGYNLNDHSWQTILSPSRIEPRHPVEQSGEPFVLPLLFRRPGSSDVFLVVRFPGKPDHALAGIWRYESESDIWSKVAADPGCRITSCQADEDVVWLYCDQPDVASMTSAILSWDYSEPEIRMVCGPTGNAAGTDSGFRRVYRSEKRAPRAPYLRDGEFLWTTDPFGRVHLTSGLFTPMTIEGAAAPVVSIAQGTNGIFVVRQPGIGEFEVMEISTETRTNKEKR